MFIRIFLFFTFTIVLIAMMIDFPRIAVRVWIADSVFVWFIASCYRDSALPHELSILLIV